MEFAVFPILCNLPVDTAAVNAQIVGVEVQDTIQNIRVVVHPRTGTSVDNQVITSGIVVYTIPCGVLAFLALSQIVRDVYIGYYGKHPQDCGKTSGIDKKLLHSRSVSELEIDELHLLKAAKQCDSGNDKQICYPTDGFITNLAGQERTCIKPPHPLDKEHKHHGTR